MADIKRIKVGTASCGLAAGAGAVLNSFRRLAGEIPVVEVGCIGHCYCEPIVEVELKDGSSVFYSSVKADDASVNGILNLTGNGRFTVPAERAAIEKLCVTKLAGRIDPKDLEEYRAWENWVQSLSWEDSLKKELATHSSILAWRTPWTEEPGGLQSMGSQRVGHD